MAKDILSMYGPDQPDDQKPRAKSGGITVAKPLPYCPPVGPIGQNHEGPGMANGTNHGVCGTQGKH